jgi:hypothetical protein
VLKILVKLEIQLLVSHSCRRDEWNVFPFEVDSYFR